jgi:hypothetical protein
MIQGSNLKRILYENIAANNKKVIVYTEKPEGLSFMSGATGSKNNIKFIKSVS